MRFVTYSIVMRTRFRGIDIRQGMLIEGPAGWGEFSPFEEYDDRVSVSWLRAALESAQHPWPAAVRDHIPVNCTIPAVSPEEAARLVKQGAGCSTAKVKVAEPEQAEGDDLARVEAVRNAIGPHGRVRIDANGGWSVDEAVRRITALARFDLEYVEQPCATAEELAEVRRRVDVPIAADESIRTAADPLQVKRIEAADIAVLKVQPLGGVRECLRIAEQIGLPVVVSSALETSVGIAAGVALAAALPELPYACGLATVQLLQRDVVADSVLPVDGLLPVRRATPDPVSLAATSGDTGIEAAWQDRLARVQALLGASR
jgi:o-succinylbenzoate synthase